MFAVTHGTVMENFAGVPEDDPANEALQFALKYELIKKDEAKRLKIRKVDDFGDPASFGIPR
jgi:hypothetical protein